MNPADNVIGRRRAQHDAPLAGIVIFCCCLCLAPTKIFLHTFCFCCSLQIKVKAIYAIKLSYMHDDAESIIIICISSCCVTFTDGPVATNRGTHKETSSHCDTLISTVASAYRTIGMHQKRISTIKTII